jgi:hypothetical protein
VSREPSVERLHQIASRKLSAWGVDTSSDGNRLRGVLRFGKIAQPVSKAPIHGAPFTVVDHDKLRFEDPPLDVLGVIPFYDLEAFAQLEQRVQRALEARMHALQLLAQRFKRLHIPLVVVPDRLVLLGEVVTGDCAFSIEGDPVGDVRLVRFQQGRGEPVVAPSSVPPLRLEDYPAQVDLEIHLTTIAPKVRELARAVAQQGTSGAPVRGVDPVEPPGDAPTLAQLVALLGETAKLARFEAAADFLVGARRMRFFCAHVGGTTYRGKLVDAAQPDRSLWQETFDAARFPGVVQLVALVTGVEVAPQSAPQPARPPVAPPQHLSAPDDDEGMPPSSSSTPAAFGSTSQIAPQPGEVWVMPVLVERDDGAEIRYVCTDADGRPYGAARVLPKADFIAVFAAHGVGYRLNVRIEHVQGDVAVYQQLDAAGNARGAPTQLSLHQLVGAFVPEGALY